MTKELEAIERVQALAERIRLQHQSENLAPFIAELSQLSQIQASPLGLALLSEGTLGSTSEADLPPMLLAVDPQKRAPSLADSSGPIEGVKVAFYGAGEDVPDPASVASTVVIARVVGDALLDFRGRPHANPDSAQHRPQERGDVVVEMVPGDSSQAAEVTLRHADFGQVRLRVDMSGTRLKLRVELLSAAAERAMSQAKPLLRDALHKQGVTLESFDLSVRGARPAHRSKTQYVLDEEA